MRGAGLTTTPDSEEQGALPRLFGRYRLLHLLGRGGMGDVYLAKHTGVAGIERTCVVKIVATTRGQPHTNIARFFDEARVVVLLNHQNICSVSEVGEVDGQLFMAMDYVAGKELNTLLGACSRQQRELPRGLALFILGELLRALDYAHRLRHPSSGEALGIVHRDVTPHNVLLSYEGEVKLIDFGIAISALKQEKTSQGYVLGKLAYISPEQARSEPVDARGDVYAAGIVGYELLTGERFYSGRNQADLLPVILDGGHRPQGWQRLEPELARILDRALQRRPPERYQSCGELRHALEAFQQERGLLASTDTLRAFLRELFPDGEEANRALLARLDAAAPPVSDDTVVMAAVPELPPGDLPPATVVDRRPAELAELPSVEAPPQAPASPPGEPLGVPVTVEPSLALDARSPEAFAAEAVQTAPSAPPPPAPPDAAVLPTVVVERLPAEIPVSPYGAADTTERVAERRRRDRTTPPVQRRRRTWLLGLAGATALGVLGVLGWWLSERSDEGPAVHGEETAGEPDATPGAETRAELVFDDDALAMAGEAAPAAGTGAPTDAGRAEGGPATGITATTADPAPGSRPATEDTATSAPPDPGAPGPGDHHRAPRRGRRGHARASAARSAAAAPTTLEQKLELLRRCEGQPCTARVLDKSTRLRELDYAQVKSFPAELDRCVRRCRR